MAPWNFRIMNITRWYWDGQGDWRNPYGTRTYRYLKTRTQLPNHAMSDPPFDQEDGQVERAYCSVRMNDGRGGFKWSYHGDGCLERAEDMARWVREHPEEWVKINLADGAIKWYSLAHVASVEVWHDPVWAGDAPETPDAPADIEDEVVKLYQDIAKAEREGL